MLVFRVLVGKNIVLASPHPARHPTSTTTIPLAHQVLRSILGFPQLTCLTCHAHFADNKSLKDLPQVKMLVIDTRNPIQVSLNPPKELNHWASCPISGRKFPRMLFSFSKSWGSRLKSHKGARSHPHPPTLPSWSGSLSEFTNLLVGGAGLE